MAEKCIACGNTVRPRQHGVSCDSCERWQHRTCDTGISLAEYKRACNGGDLNFVCRDCMVPLHQSSTLEFNHDACPVGFIQADLRVDDRRHILFATESQLTKLAESKTWYMDGTFKCTRKPFEMLFSIHAFVRRGSTTKQVPLLYVMMSGRRAKDYESILTEIKRIITPTSLHQIVVDFESALWKACRSVFPGIRLKGCAFHWGQAVFRHVQGLGLTTEYLQETGTYSFIRQLLCLPLLPHEHIIQTFTMMEEFNTAVHLKPLLNYMAATWINSTVWPVESWSVYGLTVRTNNDVEGWHRRLNTKTGAGPPFYVLLRTLRDEAAAADNAIQLVSEQCIQRLQRKSVRSLQAKLLGAWDEYAAGNLSTTGLLKRCSTFYKPVIPNRGEGGQDQPSN